MRLVNENNIDIIIQNNKKTPRTAICCYFSIEQNEKYSGVYSLFTKLLLQGTTTRNATNLALELENNGIELSVKCKQDYLRAGALFLNEDFDLAIDILSDIMQNSTFEDFEKEVYKFKGEIASDLDIPKTKASDAFVGEIFKEHYYANNHTKTLKEIDKITKEDMLKVLENLKYCKKVISIVGDFENEQETLKKLGDKLGFMQKAQGSLESNIKHIKELEEDSVIKIVKNDANQAQIIQGWIVESVDSEDYPKIIVANNILGSSGLSSRLFCELRDKQGLAYTVRSSYEALKHGAILDIYIATSVKNIKKSLNGFKEEIAKLQTTLVSEKELQGGKENVLGRLEYFSQTNMHIASTKGYDYIMGLDIDFEEKYRKLINKVSAQDIMYVAQKYFSKKSVTTILATEESLKNM